MEKVVETDQKYQVGKSQAIMLLIVLTLLYVINYGDRAILSVVLQPMKIALGLSDTEMGIVQTAFSLGVGLLTVPGAFLMERWSRRKALGIMAMIWSLATLATGLGSRFFQVVIARFFVGIGEGSFAPGSTAWLSVVFPKNARGKITGIFGIGTVLGTVIGMALGGLIVTKTGDWRAAFYYFAIPGIILGVLVFFFKDYATVKEDKERALNKAYLSEWIKLFKIKSFTFTTLGQVMWGFYYFTFLGWLPTLLMRGYGMDAAQAGGTLGVVLLLGIVGSPFGGWLADVWQKRNSAGRALLMVVVQLANLILIGAMLCIYGKFLTVFTVLLAIDTFIIGFCNPLIYSLTSDIIPIKHRISGFSLLMTFVFIFGAVGPWLIGAISDAFGGGASGLQMGFFLTLPALLLAALFYFFNSRTYAADSARCSDLVFTEQGTNK